MWWDNLPSVVCAQDRCHTSTNVPKRSASLRPGRRQGGGRFLSDDDAVSIDTYRLPVANIAVVNIFFFMGICNFQRDGIGRIKIAKSVMTLKIAIDTYSALVSMQWPVVINGFQIFSRGVHWAMAEIVATRYVAKQLQIQTCVATKVDIFPFLLGTKILRYWRRIDSLTKNRIG